MGMEATGGAGTHVTDIQLLRLAGVDTLVVENLV
jgi:hypothetical protein